MTKEFPSYLDLIGQELNGGRIKRIVWVNAHKALVMLELEDGRIENISIEEGKEMLKDEWWHNGRLGPPIEEGPGKDNMRLGPLPEDGMTTTEARDVLWPLINSRRLDDQEKEAIRWLLKQSRIVDELLAMENMEIGEAVYQAIKKMEDNNG